MSDQVNLPAAKVNMPPNELIFLEHVTHDLGFRTALVEKQWDVVMQDLDRMGIRVEASAKPKLLEAIKTIDWSDLRHLETSIK